MSRRRYPDEDFYDYEDDVTDAARQKEVDAYAEGLRIGRLGLGAGLCPEGYSDDERKEWMKGYARPAARFIPAVDAESRLIIINGHEPLIFTDEQTEAIATLLYQLQGLT